MEKTRLYVYLLPQKYCGHIKPCPLLSVPDTSLIRNKTPDGNFIRVSIMNFIPDWESDIVNWAGMQINLSQNWYYYAKNKISFFFKKYSFQASKNPLRKKKVYKMKVMIWNSAIKGYHELHVRSHKYFEMLTLTTSILLLTRLTL